MSIPLLIAYTCFAIGGAIIVALIAVHLKRRRMERAEDFDGGWGGHP